MRPWHIAVDLSEVVEYALTDEYWELAERN